MYRYEFFQPGFVSYSPGEVRRIRAALGESIEDFANRFFVSKEAVKSWEAPEGSAKHREVIGAAARCMYWAAVEANERPSAKNNLIRLSAAGAHYE